MKLRAKLTILMISVFITLMGFDLMIPSSLVEWMKISKKAGYQIIANLKVEEARAAVLSSFSKPSIIIEVSSPSI
ncbi:hypothetical protein ES702_07792 [subsurface metagenome]